MEQHSKEWYLARLGKWTGSEVGKLMVSGRSKGDIFGETAKDYIFDKASERLLRDEVINDGAMWMEYYNLTSISSKAMEFGTEQEPYARKRYAKLTGYDVHEWGFAQHKDIPTFGTSPDGLIIEDGKVTRTLEIKCPIGKTYIKYASSVTDWQTLKKVNPQYYWQCVSHCSCLGTPVTDFVVFNPFLKPDARLKIVSIEPPKEDFDLLVERVLLAENMCQTIIDGICQKKSLLIAK